MFKFLKPRATKEIRNDPELGEMQYGDDCWQFLTISRDFGYPVALFSPPEGPDAGQRALILDFCQRSSEIIALALAFAKANNRQTTEMGDLTPYSVAILESDASKAAMTIELTDENADWVIGVDLINGKPIASYSAD